jgi:hypothetical protein
VSFQQRMVIYGFMVGLLILGVVVWGFWLIIGRMRSKREEKIMTYQQEMLKMVKEMAALPGCMYGVLPGNNQGYGILPVLGIMPCRETPVCCQGLLYPEQIR